MAARLSQDIARVLALPDVKARLHDAGAEAAPSSADEFGHFLSAELAKWGRVVKAGNIQAD